MKYKFKRGDLVTYNNKTFREDPIIKHLENCSIRRFHVIDEVKQGYYAVPYCRQWWTWREIKPSYQASVYKRIKYKIIFNLDRLLNLKEIMK